MVLNGGSTQVKTVNLSAGRQFITASLNAPILPGQRVLTATLQVGGLSSQAQAAFAYGDSLPDLRPGLPWVEARGIVTRIVNLDVRDAVGNDKTEGAFITVEPRTGYDMYLPIILNAQQGMSYHKSKTFSGKSINSPGTSQPLNMQVWHVSLPFLTLLMLLIVNRLAGFVTKETTRVKKPINESVA